MIDFSQFPDLCAGDDAVKFALDGYIEDEPFMFLGDVGVSKSRTTLDAAEAADIGCEILDLCCSDVGDLIGLPYTFQQDGQTMTGFARPQDPIEVVTVRAEAVGRPVLRWDQLPAINPFGDARDERSIRWRKAAMSPNSTPWMRNLIRSI